MMCYRLRLSCDLSDRLRHLTNTIAMNFASCFIKRYIFKREFLQFYAIFGGISLTFTAEK